MRGACAFATPPRAAMMNAREMAMMQKFVVRMMRSFKFKPSTSPLLTYVIHLRLGASHIHIL
jgi:hypothetical protein